jgi:hypothetical protein
MFGGMSKRTRTNSHASVFIVYGCLSGSKSRSVSARQLGRCAQRLRGLSRCVWRSGHFWDRLSVLNQGVHDRGVAMCVAEPPLMP